MTLPASGAIAVSQVRTELAAAGQLNLGATSVRSLAVKASGAIKLSDLRGKSNVGTYTTGPNSLYKHSATPAHVGTLSATLCVGGNIATAYAETFNGTAWTAAATYPILAHASRGAGTQSAAVVFGGTISNTRQSVAYSWDGTAWAASAAMSAQHAWHAGGGDSVSSAFACGGATNSLNYTAVTEKFNGTAWTTIGAALTAMQLSDGSGSSGDGMKIAGYNTATLKICERLASDVWSSTTSLPVARGYVASCGTTSTTVVPGGGDSGLAASAGTYKYDGTAWALGLTLPISMAQHGCTGNSASYLVFGSPTLYTYLKL